MSLERVLRTLKDFGLSRADAEVYVYLAKQGSKKMDTIENALIIHKRQLQSILKFLQRKGVVTKSSDSPTLFSAVGFEKALDLLAEADLEQANAIKDIQDKLLSEWRSMINRDKT